MKVVIAEVEEWESVSLRECVAKDEATILTRPFSFGDVETHKDTEILCVFIHSKIDSTIIQNMPKLKYIITRSTGFDHIDIQACKKKKIKVLNVPAYGTETVAEHTFALMLALAKKIPEAIERAKEGKWDIQGLQGFDLADKTLGIIGLGKIGLEVARKAKAFNMQILVLSPKKDKKIAKEFGLRYVSLHELLKKSDVITLHAPLTKETKHMINMHNIKDIKKGAFVINTARGGLIETKALLEALDSGRLAGAGLDVLEGENNIIEEHELLQEKKLDSRSMEELLENHMLLKERNVLVTPHTAFYTKEALARILETTCENIRAVMKNKPGNLVN